MKALFAKLRNAINLVIAWVGFVLACIGGLAATSTFLGTWIVGAVHILPWWAPWPLIVIGGVCVLGDLARDGLPERLAIYIPMFWPSFFMAIEGDPKKGDAKLEEKMSGWVKDLSHWLDGNLGEWVGRGGAHAIMTIAAMTCIISAVFIIERYGKKRATTGAATGAGVRASTNATATPPRRR